MMKGLMDCCISHETVLGLLKEKTGCKGDGGSGVAGLEGCLDREARLDQAALKGVEGTS